MPYFRGKIVWVTGASSGIGAALARALAVEGCRLILSARRQDVLRQVAADCAADVRLLPFDLAEHAMLRSIAEEALGFFGGIDIMIHNAGVGQRGGAGETQLEVVKRIMAVNFFGPVAITQAILPHMLERGSGQIVVVSSVLGKFHLPGRSAYTASKHALHGYFDTLRAELDNQKIAITLICPGWIATDISQNALCADGRVYGRSDRPPRRQMSATECARHMLIAIQQRRREAYIGGYEVYGRWLKLLWPSLFDVLARRLA
ncbi:MAG: SDR family oxidoreductase [Planctomycetota bacterium]|nr:SDR family oxidoreductase [Planctomycetota bacterium]